MATAKAGGVAVVAVSRKGVEMGRRLKLLLGGSRLYLPQRFSETNRVDEQAFAGTAKETVAEVFHDYRSLVLIMAVGAAVRLLAGVIQDKHRDPALVVVDDTGKFAVSLLSGHMGGANKLAQKVASLIGAQPVVTTASDLVGTIAADLLGKEFGWEIEDGSHLTAVSAALVNGDPVGLYQDAGERDWWPEDVPLPENVHSFTSIDDLCRAKPRAALIITDSILDKKPRLPGNTVLYRPKTLAVGIGCNRGTPAARIEEAVAAAFSAHGLSVKSIRNLATIDIKKDEAGIADFARKYRLPVAYFDKEALLQAKSLHPSEMVLKHVGTPAVCEAAALLGSGADSLIMPKQRFKGAVTVAVARLAPDRLPRKGKLFLVGLGPGSPDHMTFRAREAIDQSEVVVGYNAYIDLIQPLIKSKRVIATGMGAEVERTKAAITLARQGKTVSLVSSGDSGIYGMAGLVGEILHEQPGDAPDIEVVPGVTSAVAAAALLGSPVTVDFAAISLSDHLVKWEDIRRRLFLAAQGDFVIVLYNPSSRKRRRRLDEARQAILQYRAPATPVGIVTNAFREGQGVAITDLEHMLEHEIGMNTAVIIGNSATFNVNGWMVTPRGYGARYDLRAEAAP